MAAVSVNPCNNILASHVYVNSFSGLINYPQYFAGLGAPVPQGSGLEPNAGGGTLTFTSGSAFTYKETLAIANMGLYQDTTIQGTYTLSPDASTGACTGTMSGAGNLRGLTLPFTYKLIVSNDTYRVDLMNTNTGLLIGFSGEGLTPGPAVSCSNASLNSTGFSYAYDANGWTIAPANTPSGQMFGGYIPLVITGSILFTPAPAAGTIAGAPSSADLLKASDTVSINGRIASRTVTGWYVVNANCTGTMVLQSPGYSDMTFEIFPSYQNLTVRAVDIDPQVTLPGNVNTPPVIIGAKFTRSDASVPTSSN